MKLSTLQLFLLPYSATSYSLLGASSGKTPPPNVHNISASDECGAEAADEIQCLAMEGEDAEPVLREETIDYS